MEIQLLECWSHMSGQLTRSCTQWHPPKSPKIRRSVRFTHTRTSQFPFETSLQLHICFRDDWLSFRTFPEDPAKICTNSGCSTYIETMYINIWFAMLIALIDLLSQNTCRTHVQTYRYLYWTHKPIPECLRTRNVTRRQKSLQSTIKY